MKEGVKARKSFGRRLRTVIRLFFHGDPVLSDLREVYRSVDRWMGTRVAIEAEWVNWKGDDVRLVNEYMAAWKHMWT
ncbi:hypothetical protein L2E82_51639 [Cichorium intybus]|nr:hypothetical protein L2E82_51639 [Cichorium intybus]